MKLLLLFVLFVIIGFNPISSTDVKKKLITNFQKQKEDTLRKCRVTHSGIEYEGDIAETKSGLLCQQWGSPNPVNKVSEHIVDSDFPDGSKKKARNYCRNPRHWKGRPWCYTMDLTVSDEECVVPICVKKECRLTGPGVEYAGLTHSSHSRECINWIDLSGVQHKDIMYDSLFPDKTRKLAENRCRNPDSDPGGPWCFIDKGDKSSGMSNYEKSYCGIPFCDPKPCMTTTTLVSSGYKHHHTVFSRLPQNTTSIDFSVKLWRPDEWRSAELRIALVNLPIPLGGELLKRWKNGIEIVMSNYRSGITPSEGDKPDWNIEPELLRGTRWQDLELTWTGGIISLKIKGKAMSVFTKDYTDSDETLFKADFQYYSIKGSHALWNFPFCSSEICNEKFITTHGDFDRRWPLLKTSAGQELKFFVRGFHTAIVELKIGAMLQYPSVQLTLLDRKQKNLTRLTLAEDYGKDRKVLQEVKTDSLLSNWEWREFHLIIDGDRLKLFWIQNVIPEPILDVKHPELEFLKWFSIGSRQSTVQWTLNCSPRLEDRKIVAEPPECVMTVDEKDFRGFQSTSSSGLTCLPWFDPTASGFVKKFDSHSFIDGSAENAKNYCRNPSGNSRGPFCFAADLSNVGFQVKMELCSPRICRSKECKLAGTGNDYIGSLNTTISKRACQRWSAESPHVIPKELLYTELYPELSLDDAENLCRNPSHDPAGLWCYTTDPAVDTDLCNVPDCDQPVGSCTIIVRGNATLQSIYVFPEWRTTGFAFNVKSWDPKKTEGIRFTIRSANNDNQLRLEMGGEKNDKIILFHNTTEGKEVVVKQKTVGHVIPSGQWAGFVLVLGFGEIQLSYKNVHKPFFSWKHTYSEKVKPFLPSFLSYNALGNTYSIGLNTVCEECHTQVTEPGLLENAYPIDWWKPEAGLRNNNTLTLHLRGHGAFIFVLHRLINDVSNRVLIEVSDHGLIVVKDKDAILGQVNNKHPIFKEHSWTNLKLEFSEKNLKLSLENTIVLELRSSKVLLFYYFSISVSTGLLKWSANCEPPNIDAAPVNGGWSDWGPWTCSVTCGGGHGRRTRKCNMPKPNLFGQPCNGSDVIEGICHDFKCGDVSPGLYKTIATLMTKKAYNIRLREGENLTIPCNKYILTELKDVSPLVNIEWMKNGKPLYPPTKAGNVSADQFIVQMSNVKLEDSGIYTCGLEDRKGVKTVIQLISVTIVSNFTTMWSREKSSITLNCNIAPFTMLFADLTQFWTLNGRLYQDPAAHWYSLVDIDLIRPVTNQHRGEWECVIHQTKHNLTWVTSWFRLGVKHYSALEIMFENIFIGEYFRPFGNRKILNNITGLLLIAVIVSVIATKYAMNRTGYEINKSRFLNFLIKRCMHKVRHREENEQRESLLSHTNENEKKDKLGTKIRPLVEVFEKDKKPTTKRLG